MFRLEGKKAVVLGVANDQSIAWGIARALHAQGAEVALTYLNEKAEPHVRVLADQISAPILMPLDVRDPVPGQTLADVMHAEAGFVRTVRARHPNGPQPVVAGNYQGGWATLLMAACNPDLTGPLILNGAPVAPWSGGYFLLNEAEIHWIVEQLFVGNRLVKNTAQLEPGVPIDIKAVKGPIFVFASQGDNITPPQQALNWIAATYADEEEIRIRGQRIIYMLHDEVGHLGIFVSSKVARKEHTELASTLETVEAMAPGLYEMVIENTEGEGQDKRFEVRFHERTMDDLAALDDGQHDEASFAAVAHMSEVQANIYETF